MPYLSRYQSTLKYKTSKNLQKKYAILLKNKPKYIYTQFFSNQNDEKTYFFHAYLITMYLRLIFNDLKYQYKFHFKKLVYKYHKKMKTISKKKSIISILTWKIYIRLKYVINHGVRKHEYQKPTKKIS